MARHTFGQSLTDWTMTADDAGVVSLAGGVVVTFWSAKTGGVQYTDLLDGSGSPTSSITSADGTGTLPAGTIGEFQGPDSGVTEMWADAGGGARFKIVATDLGAALAAIDANTSAITGLAATVDGLAVVATTGDYADLTGKPALADVATSGDYADLTGTPAPGKQVVIKTGGSWPLRATSAPDVGRIAEWIGPPPAPANGGGYALPGDQWTATP